MSAQGIMGPEGHCRCDWIRKVAQVLDGIPKDAELVNIGKVHLSLGSNALTSEVAIRVGELIPKVRHVSVGVLSAVIVKATRIPWGI